MFVFRFWRALRSFDQTDRAKFLQFVTGSSKVPLQVSWIAAQWGQENIFNLQYLTDLFAGIWRLGRHEWSAEVPNPPRRQIHGQVNDFKNSYQWIISILSRLPAAHTCFNQLDLPAYEVNTVMLHSLTAHNHNPFQTYDKLRSYLLKAIQECSEGFGFA